MRRCVLPPGAVSAPALAQFMNSVGVALSAEDSAVLVELMSTGLPGRFKQADMLEFMKQRGKTM